MNSRGSSVTICKLPQRFFQDKRGLEMDYMLSLFIFILSIAFTMLVLTQYLDLKHSEVGEVQDRLSALRVMDDLTGSPGWLSGRSDWETWTSRVDLSEKVNDQSFFLGLRKNDLYYGDRIIVPSASDPLMQTASSGTIEGVMDLLRDAGVIAVDEGEALEVILLIDTTAEDPSIDLGSPDGAVTHVGAFYAGSDQEVYLTDMRSDGQIRYDTVVIGGVPLEEGSMTDIGGRNFTVCRINQEHVLLLTEVEGGHLLPQLDGYHSELAEAQLAPAGINFEKYSEVVGGGLSSIDYTLFSRDKNKFRGQLTDLSLRKIDALRDLEYDIARSALGIHDISSKTEDDLYFHVSIVSKVDGSVVLDYHPDYPVPADTEIAEREVDVDGIPCTVVVDVWR